MPKKIKESLVSKLMTVDQIESSRIKSFEESYNYQPTLTHKLDHFVGDFDSDVLNEIILWKLNRYVSLTSEIFHLINQLGQIKCFDEHLSRKILEQLLMTKGLRLPLASTILRFRNPKFFQIIDQRSYRFIFGVELRINQNVNDQIEIYFKYLEELRKISILNNIKFEKMDRILYEMDKKYNNKSTIKY